MIPASKVLASVSKYTLPELPYAYEALEPIISRDIMFCHHQKHHQAYVSNLNSAEEKLRQALEKKDVSAAVASFSAVNFNGGGHLNHSIFWQNLSPTTSEPSSKLCKAIADSFGSMESFKSALSAKTIGIQGSGWGWLGYDPSKGCLKVAAMQNQDALEPHTGLVPLFGIDVWEHSYYLQYKNARADYVKAIWSIVNWNYINTKYEDLSGKVEEE